MLSIPFNLIHGVNLARDTSAGPTAVAVVHNQAGSGPSYCPVISDRHRRFFSQMELVPESTGAVHHLYALEFSDKISR